MTGAHFSVVLFCFVCPSIGVGARAWVVDTADHGGGSILQGLGCLPIVELFLGTKPPLVMNVVN